MAIKNIFRKIMKKVFNNLVRNTLKKFDVGLLRYSNLQQLINNSSSRHDVEFLLKLLNGDGSPVIKNFNKSKAQLRQDLFVLSELNFKKDGYFVEFGATNGIDLSNTYLLETEFNWTGILAEPAKCWHTDLRKNRNCHIDTDCVWSKSNSILMFNEVDAAELSTIREYNSIDAHQKDREKGKNYDVKTITLIDLLRKYNAPEYIDYLSIDTEGSEYEILSSFDFSQYKFQVITCEHNFTSAREKIYELLTSHGYVRKFEDVSKFDDWYVKTK
jgi:FkbM family methyltransferase